MSTTVGAYEARTRFAELLDQVGQGETVTITRRGQPVAELAPAGTARRAAERATAQAAFERLRRNRPSLGGGSSAIRAAIAEGRL
jgi:prevent-host-death family protein